MHFVQITSRINHFSNDKYKNLRLIYTNLAQLLVFYDASLLCRCGWFYLKAIYLRMIKLIKSSKEMVGKHKSTRKKKLLKYFATTVYYHVPVAYIMLGMS